MTWNIIGFRLAVRSRQRNLAFGTVSHAYLITGPAQIGKRTLARELAAALNCDAPPQERPCHGCRNCRMTAHGQHPDLIVVERSDGRKDLRVEDVRAARASVDWRPYQGRYKVYLFVDADEMNPAAANALLKTLEEPPPLVVHVLTASQAEAVPPTVLSRCRVLPLQPLSVDDLAAGLQELHGAEPDRAGRLAALSGGRAGWAIAALSAPELVAEREAAVDRAVALSDGPLSARLLLAGEVCKGESFVARRALCMLTMEVM